MDCLSIHFNISIYIYMQLFRLGLANHEFLVFLILHFAQLAYLAQAGFALAPSPTPVILQVGNNL